MGITITRALPTTEQPATPRSLASQAATRDLSCEAAKLGREELQQLLVTKRESTARLRETFASSWAPPRSSRGRS